MTQTELDGLIDLLTKRPPPDNPSVDDLRAGFEMLGKYLPMADDATVEELTVAGRPAEWVRGPDADPGRAVLYVHGGGYVIGSLNTHRRLAYDVSVASGCSVLLLDYRLAPEHPFPAAVDDAVAAYGWLLDQGFQPGQVAIAGDSAGGGLTVATLLAARDKGLAMPACGWCISPWTDMEGVGESMTSKADEDPMVKYDGLTKLAALYLNGADPKSPLAAPLYADLTGLPPLMIQVGTAEVLLDDARRLKAKAEAAGVEVAYEEAVRMIHVWHLFAPMLSEGREAIMRGGAFLKSKLA
ncbi:MAG: alpha/beta hydrolase [Alphaproteobacteria bacterium]